MAAPEVTQAPPPPAAAPAPAPAPAPVPSSPAKRGPGWIRKFFSAGFQAFFILLRFAITVAVLAAAGYLGYVVWRGYEAYPWTRDAQVEADVVGIAARVSGPMIGLSVKDNQPVKKGDLLFEIDPATFAAQVASLQAQHQLAKTRANESFREAERRRVLSEQQFISVEDYQQANARYKEDVASVAVLQAQLDLAQLDLSYTKVFSPVNGYITNMRLAVGTYVTAGQPLMALVDTDSIWVYAFFQENVLESIHLAKPGDPKDHSDRAVIELVGYRNQHIYGHVEGIGWAIYRQNGASNNLLPVISPTIDWVRLAQRFPVRIKIDKKPEQVQLRMGQTASVIILRPGDTGSYIPWWTW